ncbi:MAG: hypothetical protein ACOCNW_05130, partial [Prevotella sp.]
WGNAAMASILAMDNIILKAVACGPTPDPWLHPAATSLQKSGAIAQNIYPKAPARGGCMPLRLNSRSSMAFCGTNRLCDNRVSCIKTSCNVGITAPSTSCNPFFLLSNVL